MSLRTSLCVENFNTTFVWVQALVKLSSFRPQEHFNTTFVWVQAYKEVLLRARIKFQYNFCVGSRWAMPTFKPSNTLFQYNFCVGSRSAYFDDDGVLTLFQYNFCVGSSKGSPGEIVFKNRFQYNFCVGSSCLDFWLWSTCLHFNTTFVWVQVSTLKKGLTVLAFQYNFCVGSSQT